MTTRRMVPSVGERGFPGIGLGVFVRRRAMARRRVAALALFSAVLLLAGLALLWLA